MTFPFDVGQIAIKKYHHLGEGIDYDEVERMKTELSDAMKIIAEKEADDSPVYTFIKGLKPPVLTVAEAIASVAATLPLQPMTTPDPVSGSATNPTLSVLLQQAEEALENSNFIEAKALFARFAKEDAQRYFSST
jgi:hypothetical protein